MVKRILKEYVNRAKGFIRLFKVRSLLNNSGGEGDLTFILDQMTPELSLEKKVYWLEELIIWISDSSDPLGAAKVDHHVPVARLSFLLDFLENNADYRSAVGSVLRDFLKNSSALSLFSQSGLVQESGLWSEVVNRILTSILPSPPQEEKMSDFFSRVFSAEFDAEWIEAIPPDVVIKIVQLVSGDNSSEVFHPLKMSMAESLILLSGNVASAGLSHEVRDRNPSPSIVKLPFYQLRKKVEDLSEKLMSGQQPIDHMPLIDACLYEISESRRKVHQTFRQLEQSGVSVNLVYRLDHIGHCLNRIETLLHLLVIEVKVETVNMITYFLADLVRDGIERRGIRFLFQNNLRLIAKKIVERSGDSGEHYITKSRAEYFRMLASAGGGGALTVLTMFFKYAIAKVKLPLFFEGLATWINYSTSFLTMQALGLTLATKQPSYTASTLAGKLNNTKNPDGVRDFVDEFVRTARSQFAAVVGNIGVAVPVSFLFDYCYRLAFGRHLLDTGYAELTLASLHPYQSLTLFYAAQTGVVLWMASVAGGWLENWMVYRQLPLAIEKHRILNFAIGSERCLKISQWITHNMAGVGSNVALGFLLSFLPIIGKFLGMPLDIRHVTLSSCAFVFSLCTLWTPSMHWADIILPALSILIIGMLNFGVSFYLALGVAARARSVDSRLVNVLFKHILKRLRTSPKGFFYPSKGQSPTQNG